MLTVKSLAPDKTPSKVGFLVQLQAGHYDVGYVQEPSGKQVFTFKPEEADRAEAAIIAQLRLPRPELGSPLL